MVAEYHPAATALPYRKRRVLVDGEMPDDEDIIIMSERDDLVAEHRARFAAMTGAERDAAATLCDCFDAGGKLTNAAKVFVDNLELAQGLGIVEGDALYFSYVAQGLVEALG